MVDESANGAQTGGRVTSPATADLVLFRVQRMRLSRVSGARVVLHHFTFPIMYYVQQCLAESRQHTSQDQLAIRTESRRTKGLRRENIAVSIWSLPGGCSNA